MRILAALLAFVAGSTVLATTLAFVFGGLTAGVAGLSLAGGLVAAGFGWRQTKPDFAPPLGFWDYAMLGAFALASYRAFCWLIFYRGDEICILSPNNLGDISLHIHFIRYLASGISFWPESPILTGVPMTYPIGADLFNAMGEVLGMDTFRGLVFTGFVGALLTGYALWRWGGAFGLAALLFNGGLVGFEIFRTHALADFQHDQVWKNIFLSMLVTQRGLLFALPAGLLLLTHWRDTFFRNKVRFLPLWLEVLLYASLPLFNLHAFLFLSAILGVIFLAQPAARVRALRLVALSFIPATILVCLVTGFFSADGDIRVKSDWTFGDHGWLKLISDFGLGLPLALILSFLLIRERDPEARCLVWTAAAIFVFCCFVVLSPWPWDNMKLMVWSWLVIAPYLWKKLIRRFELIPRVAICIGLFFSGAVSLIGGLDHRQSYTLASRSELAAWQAAIKDIPATERFACEPDFNHPLLLLGRKVVCGYDGHLWSHGLPYGEKYTLLKNALVGTVPWSEATPVLRVDWLALRTKDQLDAYVPLEKADPGKFGWLYDLSEVLRPSPDNPTGQPPPPRSVDSF